MRIAIVQFPGANCERETAMAVKRAGMEPVEFLWNEPSTQLDDFAGFIIVGGFSYEDRVRAGVIAARDPLMQALKEQSRRGKPILGICNGAQILVESGLVPGLAQDAIGMALTDNKRLQNGQLLGTGYYNAGVYLKLAEGYQLNAFTRHLTPKTILAIPVAHGEGRFVIPDALLIEMNLNGQAVFQYCDAEGRIQDEFPTNPNGSVKNIAAVSNKAGNVLAIMPHPERTLAGDAIFTSMRDYITSGFHQTVAPLHYLHRPKPRIQYQAPHKAYELITELIINDNQALSLENALRQSDICVKIRRFIHWEVSADSATACEQIKASGVLYNDRKEKLLEPQEIKQLKGVTFLTRAKEDMVGLHKTQLLKHHFSIQGLNGIRHSILWSIDNPIMADSIINSHILSNPYAHDDYNY